MSTARVDETVDLGPFLAQLGLPPNTTVRWQELGGGASKDIWLVEVGTESPRRFVLRRSMHPLAGGVLDLVGEYEVMHAAYEAGVRVPHPHYRGEDADGHPFVIMDHVEGETLAPRLLRKDEYAEVRPRLAAQLGELLAPIHRIPHTDRLKTVLGPVPEEHPGRLALQLFDAIYRGIAKNPHPVFELAFRHLSRTVPAEYDVGVVHGDYRLGNVIFGPEGIRAVLDWELCHWGDPLEDIGWVAVRAWRFGRDERPVAGCGEREELWRAYEAAGGCRVDPERARWWEIFGNLRWGVITLMQALQFLDGQTRDLEKAAIGRRAAEVEGELLNLIRD